MVYVGVGRLCKVEIGHVGMGSDVVAHTVVGGVTQGGLGWVIQWWVI